MLTKQQKKKGQNPGFDFPSLSRAAIERRSWEPWTDKENLIFFESLSRNSRNWAEIAKDVGTKRQEQVRTYYYRVLRRISKMLSTVSYNLDNRDRVATLVAMLAYWEEHQVNPELDETSLEFAQALKDRLLNQKPVTMTNTMMMMDDRARAASPRLPVPEKVVIQLIPASQEIAEAVAEAGYNPRLQLTFKSKRSVSNIVEHITKKWVVASGECVAPGPIRLSAIGRVGVSGSCWGIEDAETTILSVFQQLGAPPAVKLEYYWDSAAPVSYQGFSDDAEQVYNAEQPMEDRQMSPQESVFEADAPQMFMHPLAQQYSLYESSQSASIFEMDPVAQQLDAMHLMGDPFEEPNSLSNADLDNDAHFEPMTNDDDDDMVLYDDIEANALIEPESNVNFSSLAPTPLPSTPSMIPQTPAISMPAPSHPRIIFTAHPKPKPVVAQAPIAQPILTLSSSQAIPQVRSVTPSPFSVAYNMSNSGEIMSTDPAYGISVNMAPMTPNNFGDSQMDPVSSPSDETGLMFGDASPGSPSPLRSKLFKQHERPLAVLDGSDADDDDYASAFNRYNAIKRARLDVGSL